MIYLKINDTLYPASFRQRVQDSDWRGRGSMAITASMSCEEAARLFVNGLKWQHVQQIDGEALVTDYSEYEVAGPITDNRDGTVTAKMGKAIAADTNAVLTGSAAPMTIREAEALRVQMETTFAKAAPAMTNEEVIANRVMCKAWVPGVHSAGEIYEAGGQIWQCIQGYDNDVHPDITLGNPAWNTFHKPYHGTTMETTMPWVTPTGAHDMYLSGEYMVWEDGGIFKCLSSTAYGPEDHADAWEHMGG